MGGRSVSPVTSRQRMRKCAETSATAGPSILVLTSCHPTAARAWWSVESNRSPFSAVRSMPPTNATRSSITIVFSWWQCKGRSCESSAQWMFVPRHSSSRMPRTARREGRKTGSGAPAQARTRTSTRSASCASRFRRIAGRAIAAERERRRKLPAGKPHMRLGGCDLVRDSRQRLFPIDQDLERAATPRRGSPSAHSPSEGSSARPQPTRSSRRRWCDATPLATDSPNIASAEPKTSRIIVIPEMRSLDHSRGLAPPASARGQRLCPPDRLHAPPRVLVKAPSARGAIVMRPVSSGLPPKPHGQPSRPPLHFNPSFKQRVTHSTTRQIANQRRTRTAVCELPAEPLRWQLPVGPFESREPASI